MPLFSLVTGVVLVIFVATVTFRGQTLSGGPLVLLGVLPFVAAVADLIRVTRRSSHRATQPSVSDGDSETVPSVEELQRWVEDKSDELAARERRIHSQALALQHWMQFPDVIDLSQSDSGAARNSDDLQPKVTQPNDTWLKPADAVDPMAIHDRELFSLVESKTQELFEKIKQDHYRKSDGVGKSFDLVAIQQDVRGLIADVAAIYRPNEADPLLQTNIESLARATGRASLRLLVALENLPGGIHQYDFVTIYQVVGKAVRTYGMYKSAKPYLDVASNLYAAGRLLSATNPLTLAAWWAASRATTYGASRIGQHLIDQQAVGLIRQLVEIVAIEVASLYSPMIRYRDVNWIYGVELVHLASELAIDDFTRAEAIREVASLQLPDEYARVSLLRHLASGSTSRPDRYAPSEVLSVADRMRIAERLERFVLSHVVSKDQRGASHWKIERWQSAASNRLDIQFRAVQLDASPVEQRKSCVWSLAAYLLEHADMEVDMIWDQLEKTSCWESSDKASQQQWRDEILSDPPYLYHWPMVDPKQALAETFLHDLVQLAAQTPMHSPAPMHSGHDIPVDEPVLIPPSAALEIVSVTAYYLRQDAEAATKRFHEKRLQSLLTNCTQSISPSLSPEATHALQWISQAKPIRWIYGDAKFESPRGEAAGWIALIDDRLVGFLIEPETSGQTFRTRVVWNCTWAEAKIKRVSGYVRDECQLSAGGSQPMRCTIAGSILRGYEAYFDALLKSAN